ncbi:MAG: hypothetical protein ABI549_00350 [Flavobacterium sp.]|uniref:hypothetical protein n=1 Tax=Flavobacterium sp. TaxID=239 RepID=UPI003264A346
MTYDMLGLFSFCEVNTENFQICFEIPDNCNYEFTANAGICTIAIKLNPEEKQPSTNFVTCKETSNIINNKAVANFEQYQKSGVTIKKPNITIGF